jgi:hypothetical protein
MECTICERKFNSNSSFYRHNWSNTHLLMCQIFEYEKQIKELEAVIAQNHNTIEKLTTLALESAPCTDEILYFKENQRVFDSA